MLVLFFKNNALSLLANNHNPIDYCITAGILMFVLAPIFGLLVAKLTRTQKIWVKILLLGIPPILRFFLPAGYLFGAQIMFTLFVLVLPFMFGFSILEVGWFMVFWKIDQLNRKAKQSCSEGTSPALQKRTALLAKIAIIHTILTSSMPVAITLGLICPPSIPVLTASMYAAIAWLPLSLILALVLIFCLKRHCKKLSAATEQAEPLPNADPTPQDE